MPFIKGKERSAEPSDRKALLTLSVLMLAGFFILQANIINLTGRNVASLLVAIYGLIGLKDKRINIPFVTATGRGAIVVSALFVLAGITTLAIEILWL